MKCPKCKTGNLRVDEAGWRSHRDLRMEGNKLVITQTNPVEFSEDDSSQLCMECDSCDYGDWPPDVEWK